MVTAARKVEATRKSIVQNLFRSGQIRQQPESCSQGQRKLWERHQLRRPLEMAHGVPELELVEALIAEVVFRFRFVRTPKHLGLERADFRAHFLGLRGSLNGALDCVEL